MLVHCRVTLSIKFVGTHLYTWVERGTVRVKCLARENNTISPGLEPGPLDPETSELTRTPPRLQIDNYTGLSILLGSHVMKLEDLNCSEKKNFFRTVTGREYASIRVREMLRHGNRSIQNVTELFCTIGLKFKFCY